MKRLIIFSMLLGSSSLMYAQDSAAEQWYDFWVGNWDLTWQGANGGQGTGTNQITRTLDGKVIEENFSALTGNLAGYKGMSVSVYNPAQQKWKQTWVDNQGGYIEFTGRKEGDRYYFETEMTETPQGKVQRRMVFYDITEDALTWDWEVSRDGGETWTLNWRINYARQEG